LPTTSGSLEKKRCHARFGGIRRRHAFHGDGPVAEIAKVGIGEQSAAGPAENHHTIRRDYRQRAQEQRIEDAENRRVDADAESQAEHGEESESGRPGDLAECIADISHDGF